MWAVGERLVGNRSGVHILDHASIKIVLRAQIRAVHFHNSFWNILQWCCLFSWDSAKSKAMEQVWSEAWGHKMWEAERERAGVQRVLKHCGGSPGSTVSSSVSSPRLLMYLLPQLFLFSGVSGRLSAAFPDDLWWSRDAGRTAQQIKHPLLSFWIRGEGSYPHWTSHYCLYPSLTHLLTWW